MTKHFLEQPNHGPESIGHPVVGLFEGDDEDMDIFDFVSESGHQALDGLLLLHQLITKARSINDCESLACSVAHPVSLVRTRPLSDAVQACAHFETAVVETSPIVVLVSTHQDICKAGLPHSDGS